MAVFNTNQNRQFYVAKSVVEEEPKALGEIMVGATKEGQIFFKHFGHGGLTRTDLIDAAQVTYAKITKADQLARALKTATIKLDPKVNGGNPIASQDYVVRIYIDNYLAPGDDNVAIKHGAVHAYAGMTPQEFYEKLAKSLEMNFSREIQPLLTFKATATGVEIEEVEQPWNLGTRSQDPVNFRVQATTVRWQGDDYIWAERDAKGYIPVEEGSTIIGDGKKIADLEYFCMGERGDQYRGMGWPNIVPTKYMVNPDEEYDVLDMHYFFSDTGVNNQKSEKDITLVATDNATLQAIKAKLATYGITVAE